MMTPGDPPSVATASIVEADRPLPKHLSLVVASGPEKGARLPLSGGTFTVGKAPSCDLRLSDAAVSRRHLEIAVLADALEVRDLTSKNGSFYLGARFDVIRIGQGAQVTIGSTALTVSGDDELVAPAFPGERFGRMAGRSEPMRRVFGALARLARSDAAILVIGETGTGKDLAAQAVHAASARAARPFVVCDLSAIPGSLIEAELFGHLRGAFTGAERDRAGAFEQADGGTIFLDEVGELSLALQPRLLRLLESQTVKRLGDGDYRSFDVRVVAATNRDLAVEVAAGRFRADLYHRLAVAQVRIPPLRDRIEDVPFLVEGFLAELAGKGLPRLALPNDTLAALCSYAWPGNVRQLRNVIERAVALAASDGVLSPALLGIERTGGVRLPRLAADPSVPFKDAKERLVDAWELDYLNSLVDKTRGNIAQAARVAGIDRAHLYRLLRKHGLHRPGSGEA